MHETNTFNTTPTTLADFRLLRGHELFQHAFWRGNAEATGGIIETLQAEGADVVPSVHAVAMVSGIVENEAYITIKEAVLEALRAAGPLDGICFCLHGSMYASGVEDPEGDLMSAIREEVGMELPIVCALDMHATVTDLLVRSVNAFAVFRTAPHTDRYSTGVRAAELLLRMIRRGQHVVTVSASLPFLVCGENSMTTVSPMKELIAEVYAEEREKHVLNADYTLGFPWADTPYHGVRALVSGEAEQIELLMDTAIGMADRLWKQRERFVYSEAAYPLDEALDAALRAPNGTVMLSDTGDNPTAGASSNLTIVLERLLERGIDRALLAVIADEASFAACRDAGEGSVLELSLGRRHLQTNEGLPVRAEVVSVHLGVDGTGRSKERCDAAVVRIGGVDVIIAERRIAVYDPEYLTMLGLRADNYRLIVVKSGYLSPAYRSLGVATLFVLTPGESTIALKDIKYANALQPLYPQDPVAAWNPDEERARMREEAERYARFVAPDHRHEPIFAIPFSPEGYAKYGARVTKRTLSQLKPLYDDQAAVDALLACGDPVVYEVYEMPYPYSDTDLLINITVLFPGRVGRQYHMTKGHFHAEPDTAEAVIGLEGEGEMLLQRRNGELRRVAVGKGMISYSGGGWSHRVVNTGLRPLIFFAVSGANIVHDYATAQHLNFK